MRKQTLYGAEARTKIFDGVKKITAAVKVTLGPLGRNVLISQSMVVDYGVHSLPLNVTKDGYRTAIGFDLDDHFEKAGVLLVKEACQKTVDQAGDGTTTTAVLLEAIVEEGIRLINEGVNPMELKRVIDSEVEYVVERLKEMAAQIGNDNEKIFQIATISANNDIVIGRLIADAFKQIGSEGIIDIEPGKSVNTEIKIASGYRFQKSWVSPYFMNNKDKQICEFSEPLILIYQNRITHHTQIQRALELSMQLGKPLLIICEDAADEGLGFMVMNNFQNRVRICVVKAPEFGVERMEAMEDIALLTGGSYITDIRGINIKEIEVENLGNAKKVIVTKEETTIIEGAGNKDEIQNLLNELRMNLAQAKNENDRFPIEKRIARLIGGVAVIQVGAATETEMKERMDRFDDSVRATKSAISEGYVPGAGSAFLKLIPKGVSINVDALKDVPESTWEDVVKIYDQTGNQFWSSKTPPTFHGIIFNILKTPLEQICKNAGIKSDQILKLISLGGDNDGYNAKTDKVEDLVIAGVIDPVKVLRCALQNAASSAGMVLTTECLIADLL